MQPNTILLKGDPVRKEGVASSAITPGHLLTYGGVNDVTPHPTAGGAAPKAFAFEAGSIGRGVDDAYQAGEQVRYGVCRQGDEVWALLAAGQSVSRGDGLESAGNGTLQKVTTGEVIAYALEDVNNSGGASAVRIKAEVA